MLTASQTARHAAGTTAYAYAAGGQLWTEDGPWSSDTVTNTYNNRLRTAFSLAQPTGAWTNSFGYDTAKRLTNVISQAGGFAYLLSETRPSALVNRLSLPNTSYITNTYDTVARLTGTWLKNSSHSTLDSHEYTYNQGNQRTKHTRADDSHLTFNYDSIGQLTIVRATNSGGTIIAGETKGYFYDEAWNLNRRTNNSSGSTYYFKVDTRNQLTNATLVGKQTYDDNGNLILNSVNIRYAYDDENQLANWYSYEDYDGNGEPTSFGDTRTEFIYDGRGRLRKRVEYGVTGGNPYVWSAVAETRYIYDGWRVIQERNSSNTPTVSYTRGSDLSGSLEGAGGIGGLLARSHGYSGGNWSTHNFYHADGNGNITYVVNSSQALAGSYRYDPYGNTISSSGSLASANVYRFSSKELHANSELYYYGYRWYAPELQRWLNRDPRLELGHFILRYRDSVQVGVREHPLYNFVRNSPIHRLDPLGLDDRGWPFNGVVCNDCMTDGEGDNKVYVLINGEYYTLPSGKCTANDPAHGSVSDVDGVWICRPKASGKQECVFYSVKPNFAPFMACGKPPDNCPKWNGDPKSPNSPYERSGHKQRNSPPAKDPPIYRPPRPL